MLSKLSKRRRQITSTSMVHSDLIAATVATRQRWDARYQQGVTPWDTEQTPPEVVDFWQSARLPPHGLALDLGCGAGTNVRYLANQGLTTIGVEIAGAPLIKARQRQQPQAIAPIGQAHFIVTDVCLLPFHNLNAVYILDIGCFHSLPRSLRTYYVENVIANLAPGGYYHLYAFDADAAVAEPTSGPVGMKIGEVAQRFGPHLTLVEERIARPDRRPCRWYLLQCPL
jgi:SAM-dependent methyltransferase